MVRGGGDECTVTVVRSQGLDAAAVPWQGSLLWSFVRTYLPGNGGSELNLPVPESQRGSPPGGCGAVGGGSAGGGAPAAAQKGHPSWRALPGTYLGGTSPFPT